ncbi:MAG: response regulator transcription factor [Ruminococcus sp.]|mgnify:CR=1 FL=1|nr:response regulator transcription factor [Ruminococcus sp.]
MKKILIVEDDAAIRTELITLLRSNGYTTVENSPCDLILMDINLPGESGFTHC